MKHVIFLIPAAISLFTSCSLFSENRTVQVQFPPLPPWTADVRTGEWELCRMTAWGVERLRVSGETATLKVEKGRPVVLTVSPVLNLPDTFRLKPAGCVLGAAEAAVTTQLNPGWDDGFAAAFLIDSADSGAAPQRVNLSRFRDTARTRGGNRPWRLNTRYLAEQASGNKLRVYSFRQLDLHRVSVELEPGNWYPAAFPFESLEVSGAVWDGELPVGLHVFIRIPGHDIVWIDVDDQGDVTVCGSP